jgi:hypothetical protein
MPQMRRGHFDWRFDIQNLLNYERPAVIIQEQLTGHCRNCGAMRPQWPQMRRYPAVEPSVLPQTPEL